MNINLVKAMPEDVQEIHHMQMKSFKNLLDKYKDYDTNPGNEILNRFWLE